MKILYTVYRIQLLIAVPEKQHEEY